MSLIEIKATRREEGNHSDQGREGADLGTPHEDREACRSPRSERRVSAFRRRGDRIHAGREFDLDDFVLSRRTNRVRQAGATRDANLRQR